MSKLELLFWVLMPAAVIGAESCGIDGLCGAESDVMLQTRQNVERHLEVSANTCIFREVTANNCPCSQGDSSGCNLAECGDSTPVNGLCENDAPLANGSLFQNNDNCPGAFDVLQKICDGATPAPTTPPPTNCIFREVTANNCPCSQGDSSGCNLAECGDSTPVNGLCENDAPLANGSLFQNNDNCPGAFDVLQKICGGAQPTAPSTAPPTAPPIAPPTAPPPVPPTPPPTAPPSVGTQFPDQFFTCAKAGGKFNNAVGVQTARNDAKYNEVRDAIIAVFNSVPGKDDACTADKCPFVDFLGCTLRMAGHDFMDGRFIGGQTFNGLGADGCIDMNDHDNDGLMPCMKDGEFGAGTANLNTAYGAVCDTVSLADFFVIAGETAISFARQQAIDNPTVATGGLQPKAAVGDFTLGLRGTGFEFGRVTSPTCAVCCQASDPIHEPTLAGVAPRLPGGMHGCNEVDRVFVKGLGLSWRQATALMGVHTLGRASLENSPFDGPWSELPQQMRWNNDYYYSVIAKGWAPMHTGKDSQNPTAFAYWVRSDGGGSSARNSGQHNGGREMMLDTDMCLFWSITNHVDTSQFQGKSGDMRIDSVDAQQALQFAGSSGGCCMWVASDNSSTDRSDGYPGSIINIIEAHKGPSGASANGLHCNTAVPGTSHCTMNDNCCRHGPGPTAPDVLTNPSCFVADCTSVLWIPQGVSGGFQSVQAQPSGTTHSHPMGRGNDANGGSAVADFALDETMWLNEFEIVWRKVTRLNVAFSPVASR